MGSIGFVKDSGKINNSLDRWIAHCSGQNLGGESSIGQLKHSLICFNAELRRHALQSLLENLDLLRSILNLCLFLVKDGLLPEMLMHLRKDMSRTESASFKSIGWLTAKPIEEPIQ